MCSTESKSVRTRPILSVAVSSTSFQRQRLLSFMILIIDNFDSFVHNLARYFRCLGCEVLVRRNNEITLAEIEQQIDGGQIQGIVLSPGPCSPREAGICLPLVSRFFRKVPILGVCLGHQAIAEALGGEVVRWHEPIHGKAAQIIHDQQHEFAGIESPFFAARYHSLVVRRESLPEFFTVSACLADQTVMAIRHRRYPIVGYQFHPESILTDHGLALLQGFLRIAHIPFVEASCDDQDRELQAAFPAGALRKTTGNLDVDKQLS